jgi:hypothetical protein
MTSMANPTMSTAFYWTATSNFSHQPSPTKTASPPLRAPMSTTSAVETQSKPDSSSITSTTAPSPSTHQPIPLCLSPQPTRRSPLSPLNHKSSSWNSRQWIFSSESNRSNRRGQRSWIERCCNYRRPRCCMSRNGSTKETSRGKWGWRARMKLLSINAAVLPSEFIFIWCSMGYVESNLGLWTIWHLPI